MLQIYAEPAEGTTFPIDLPLYLGHSWNFQEIEAKDLKCAARSKPKFRALRAKNMDEIWGRHPVKFPPSSRHCLFTHNLI